LRETKARRCLQTRRLLGTLNRPVVVIFVLVVVVAVDGFLFFREHSPRRVLVVAAGDIADCSSKGDEATAKLVEDIDANTVLAVGDLAYQHGTAEEFADCYDPTWGQFKERTRPIPGNHDYGPKGASAYFEYFGHAAGDPQKGYYSYDLGSWHLVALNSICKQIGGCGRGSAELEWLRRDLATNSARRCTLVYVHDPLFSARRDANSLKVSHFYEVLYAAGVDVVLSGDYHNYQRFEPQDPEGNADYERGIRQFVVGTGGRDHYAIGSPIENLKVYNDNTYGVLKLTLKEGGYEWRFVPVEGETFTDSGSARCNPLAPIEGTHTTMNTQ
jgi:hypothetical protein